MAITELDQASAGRERQELIKEHIRKLIERLRPTSLEKWSHDAPEKPRTSSARSRWPSPRGGTVCLIQLVQGDRASTRYPNRTSAPPR